MNSDQQRYRYRGWRLVGWRTGVVYLDNDLWRHTEFWVGTWRWTWIRPV